MLRGRQICHRCSIKNHYFEPILYDPFLALNQFHSYSFNVTCDNFEQYLVIFETNCFSICDAGLPTDTCKESFAQKPISLK